MSNPLRQPMTMAEFVDWEERQPAKHEFDGFQPIAMAGGSLAHAEIQGNLAISIRGGLRGTPCRFIGSDFQLHLASTVRYPDGTVICGPQDQSARGSSAPVVVFEIISPSTAAIDRIVKVREYQATPSVQRYVILEQDQIAATIFARSGEGWSGTVLRAGEVLAMPEIGLSIPLDDLYLGVGLPEPGPE